jgi:hypothetical protein
MDQVVKDKQELYDRWIQEQSREEDLRRTADGGSR